MIRRFNYTGRVKIPKNRIDITLLNNQQGKYFKAAVDLDGLNLPGDAGIYIEPNYKGVYQRFDFGTVSEFKEPESTYLTELPETELAYFDISIVDEKGKAGLILAKAKGIAISTLGTPNSRISLLPVNPADLKNQFWKLTFSTGEDGRPVLEINKNIPDFAETARNDIKFISLVYPAALKEILTRIIEKEDTDGDEDSWVSQWLRFISTGLNIKTSPPTDNDNDELTAEQEEWIDECVNEFCKKFQLFEKFTAQ